MYANAPLAAGLREVTHGASVKVGRACAFRESSHCTQSDFHLQSFLGLLLAIVPTRRPIGMPRYCLSITVDRRLVSVAWVSAVAMGSFRGKSILIRHAGARYVDCDSSESTP
jgi:hypothetical protein